MVILLLGVLFFMMPFECEAAGPVPAMRMDQPNGKIDVGVGKSVIVRTSRAVTRVSMGTDAVADFVLLSPNQIYVTGKAPGVTNMTLWGTDDKVIAIYDVEAAPDVSRIMAKLHQILPKEKDIKVFATHEALTLTGTVSSSTAMSHALAVAEAYNTAKDQKVVNLLEVSGVQQVMLEVKVAEMARSLGRRLGINFIASHNGSIGGSLIGNVASIDTFTGGLQQGSVELTFSDALNSFFHIAGGDFTFTQFMDALKDEGLVKILAEPTLITLSGQQANFLAGGEFPVPVPQGLGTVGIEYKNYGVGLTFTPTVLSDGKISMRVMPEVSELDLTTAVTIQAISVPGLTTRKVSTVVELGDGQTFAIAGLLKDTVREDVQKFPLLGELPVLGPLFRSSSFQRNETELVIMVTPRLVKPLDKRNQRLPTDSFIEPSDCEFYLMGVLQGRPVTARSPLDLKGKFEGDFGHSVPQ